MPAPISWTEREDQALIHYVLNIRDPGGSWSDAPEHVPGRSAEGCSKRYLRILQLREPTDIEREAFAEIYKREKRAMWEAVTSKHYKKNPWANLGTLADRQLLEANSPHWYYKPRKTMWNPIAVEMNIPARVVETMFFMLEEEDRAVV